MASVLITGAGGSIGFATCVSLARAGHRVFATMRDPGAAPELGRVAMAESLPITIFAMNVNSEDSVHGGIGRILDEHGSLDVLVNNAGIQRVGTIEALGLEDFRAVMETNYFGAIRCIQAVLPTMLAQGRGWIVNVASAPGRDVSPRLGAYRASKFALEAISDALQKEMEGLGIRVAILQPAITDTPMAEALSEPSYPGDRRSVAPPDASNGPELVAEKIHDILGDAAPGLRHPVGPPPRSGRRRPGDRRSFRPRRK